MATTPFIWGAGGEKLTPEQVKRLRENSQHKSDFSPVGHWTQGAARLFDAWGDYRGNVIANKSETAGMSSADDYIQNNPVLASLIGSGGSGVSMGVPQGAMPPQATGAPLDAMQSTGGGLPASLVHSESGGNWNALNSEGYGGRGQFGEARLADAARAGIIPAGMTGESYSQAPEEVQLAVENWHRADILGDLGKYVGVDVDGPGPIPPLTADSILSVAHLGGTGGARRFIESGGRYNPSDSNGTSLADYATRHAGGASAGGYSGGAQPQNNAGVIQALTGAMSDPWVAKKYGPVLEALMGQQMKRGDMQYQQQLQQSDPMYQAKLAKLTAPAEVDPWAGTQVINGQVVRMTPNGPEAIGNFNTPDPGYQMVSPEEVARLGLPEGAYQRGADGKISKIGGGGVTVNNDLGGPELGKLSTDYGYIMDPATGKPVIDPATGLPKAAPVPGSPAAQGIAEAAATDARADSNRNTSTSVITSAASRAREAAEQRVVGGLMGAAAAYNPGSQNAEVYRQNEVLKSNAKVENLNAMRAASKTGGALGSVTEKEAQMLADKSGALDPASPNYLRDLDDYERTLLQVVHGYEAGNEIFQATRGGGQDAPDFSSDTPPAGLDESDADLWPYATPEERQAIWGQ